MQSHCSWVVSTWVGTSEPPIPRALTAKHSGTPSIGSGGRDSPAISALSAGSSPSLTSGALTYDTDATLRGDRRRNA